MRIIKDILIILLMTFVILFIIDIPVRIYLYIKTDNTAYLKPRPWKKKPRKEEFPTPRMQKFGSYYKFVPGIYKHRISHLDPTTPVVEYYINLKGFRNDEFDDLKTPGTTRVFCFGGSSTMGQNSPYETTYPQYLQGVLNRKFKNKKFEVINIGLSGYSMEKIYNLFKNEVVNYDPDIMTVYSAFNDASYTRNLVYKKNNPVIILHELLYYRWMLYTVLLEKYSVMKHKNPIPFFIYKDYKPVEIYVKNLGDLIKLAKEKKIRLILIKQPINVDVTIDFDKETIDTLKDKIEAAASMKEIRSYTQYLLIKEMERLSRENGITIVDPLGIFEKNKEEYFIDQVHLTPKGNVKLAEIVAESF